jgi:hypothetical protein
MPILIPTPGMLLRDLVPEVLDRLEESRTSPIFWNVPKEIAVFLVEAMNEATLLTGEPEIKFTNSLTTAPPSQLALPANTNVVTYSGDIPIFGMMRLESAGQVKKTTVWDMDRMTPGWENDVGNVPDFWFPIGLTEFGIHPKLNAPVTVIVSGISEPVIAPRPYTGMEPIDFQTEYREAFVDYAAHVSALKEGTKEFVDSIKVYERFISKMQELGKFASRKGVLRFSRTLGAPASTTPVEVR